MQGYPCTVGGHSPFEFWSQEARSGVGWGCKGGGGCARACMEPYLSIENPVCRLDRPWGYLSLALFYGHCSPCCFLSFKIPLHHKISYIKRVILPVW